MDRIELVAADAIIVLDKIACQIEVAVEETAGSLDRSMFLMVAGELRDAEKRLRGRLRDLLSKRSPED